MNLFAHFRGIVSFDIAGIAAMLFFGAGLIPGALQAATREADASGTTTAAAHPEADAKEEKEDSGSSFEKWDKETKGAKLQSGFFNVYTKRGKAYLEIRTDQLDRDFLIMSSIARGVQMGDLITGMTLEEWLCTFKRVDRNIQLVRRNARFIAKKGTPVGKAVELAYSDSVLASMPIVSIQPTPAEAETKDGKKEKDKDKADSGESPEETATSFLVDITPVFVADLMGIGNQLHATGALFTLDAAKSTWGKIKAFPLNLELQTALVFQASSSAAIDEVADSRYLPITVHYSLSALPEDGYQPRLADDRVGHFVTAIKDYSSEDEEGPFVRYITRWKLEKADHKSKLSAPKRPIIYYLEKTIPFRYRHWIREGILEWNKAFAKLGFADAIEVRIQGDEEDWDPEDARYNTIRWTPGTGFAIGPSRVDPRTGQILDADILLDAGFIYYWTLDYRIHAGTGRPTRLELPMERETVPQLNDLAGLTGFRPAPTALLGADKARKPVSLNREKPRLDRCALAMGLYHEFGLATAHLLVTDRVTSGQPVPEEFVGAALKSLTMHEVGHTLGLRHNFAGSAMNSQAQLHDVKLTREKGTIASVMDYDPINVAPPGQTQGEYFPSTIGPYDYWAIEYAYAVLGEPPPDIGAEPSTTASPPTGGGLLPVSYEAAEQERPELEPIAARSGERELKYGTDEDVSSWEERDMDPLINYWDLGSDPLEHAKVRTEIVKAGMIDLVKKIVPEGKAYARLARAFTTLLFDYYDGGMYAAKYVGGQYTNRQHRGDTGASLPFTPVTAARQREALKFLGDKIFVSPELDLPPDLLNSLAPGYWMHWGTTLWERPRLDFPIHQWISMLQASALYRLLHPAVLQRVRDMELKYPRADDVFTVAELFSTLTDIIWSDLGRDPKGNDWSVRQPFLTGFRRELQRTHVKLLSYFYLRGSWHPWFDAPGDASTLAWTELDRIREGLEKILKVPVKFDPYSAAHLKEIRARIQKTLAAQAEQVSP